MKCSSENSTCHDRGCIVCEIAIIVALVLAVVVISAHAPSHFYAYAQRWQAGATLGMLDPQVGPNLPMGNWLLPHNQAGGVMRKGPVFSWLCAGGLALTGVYDDWSYNLPTIAAAIALAVVTYQLGRRWYNRRTGLLAACLLTTAMHMSRLSFSATTDMLLAVWIAMAISCADRLTFHRCKPGRRGWYVAGLWISMALAALTKGWGVVNVPIVAGTIGLAALLGGGFRVQHLGRWAEDTHLLIWWALLRRLWWVIKAVHLWWIAPFGLLVAATLGWMWLEDPVQFRQVLYFEIFQRATGQGPSAPVASTVPPAAYLLYSTFPMSIFALGSLLLTPVGRWLTRRGRTYLPLCWITVTVIPFSLAHGFRPDYLLPCYPAMALLAAWAVDHLAGRNGHVGPVGKVLRHVFAAAPVVIGLGLVVVPLAWIIPSHLPPEVTKALPLPADVSTLSWVVLGLLIPAGFAVAAWGIVASARWRLRQVAFAACVGMLGVMFLYTHFISRHARTGDGQVMRTFAADARKAIGSDEFATYYTNGLCVQVYLGELGPALARPGTAPALPTELTWYDLLTASKVRWLITCDRGLVEMGQFEETPDGHYRAQDPTGKWRTFNTRPELLSDGVMLISERPIRTAHWGRIYLIRLNPQATLLTRPLTLGYMSGTD